MNDARPPNQSASIASSGIADAPNRLFPVPSVVTGSVTTDARSVACWSVYEGRADAAVLSPSASEAVPLAS